MQFIIFIIVGAVAGLIAGSLVRGSGFGLIGNIIVGVVGGLLGGFLLGQLGISLGAGIVGDLITGVIGAVILLVVLNLIRR